MGLNWKSVKAVHVTQACEALLNSARPGPKPRGLVVTYKDKKLPAKAVLRMAYRLANNTPPETKLKFSVSVPIKIKQPGGISRTVWPSALSSRDQ